MIHSFTRFLLVALTTILFSIHSIAQSNSTFSVNDVVINEDLGQTHLSNIANEHLLGANLNMSMAEDSAIQTSQANPVITITGVSQTALCVGSPVSISFTVSGSELPSNTSFDVVIYNASYGNTATRKLASGTSSPISFTLPGDLVNGTNYRFMVVVPQAGIQSTPSEAIAIGNLTNAVVYDRLITIPQYKTDGSICPGSRATLTVYPNSQTYGPISAETYQWTRNGDIITGATSNTYSTQQAGIYGVTLQTAGCTVTSSTYTLSISAPSRADVFTPYLTNGLQCEELPLQLHSLYIGETATYQWSFNGEPITGATNSSLAANQTGSYSFTFIDGSCNITASPSYYRFSRSLLAQISPMQLYGGGPLSDTLLCGGRGPSLYASIPPSSTYSIQWCRDGLPIPGAITNQYTVSQAGIYSALFKQGSCQTISNSINISQADQLKASIVSSNGTVVGCIGENHSLLASPSVNASFQWQKDGVDIAGATSPTLVPNTTGKYTVRITRGTCVAVSDPLSLTFSNTIFPSIYTQVPSGGSCGVMTLIGSVGFASNGFSFQWYKNGTLINGANSNTFYASEPGAYSIRVNRGSCSGVSKEYYANVNSGKISKPTIVTSESKQVCADNAVQLTVYTGTSVQWKLNGEPIAGATRPVFYAMESGLYSVLIQNGICEVESDPVRVTIGEPSTARLSGYAVISSGQTAMLPVSFTGPSPWSVTLNTGESVKATYKNPVFIPVAPTNTTNYQLASAINGCGTVAMSGQAQVKVYSGSADLSLSMHASNRAPKVNEPIEMVINVSNAGPLSALGIQAQCQLPAGMIFEEALSGEVSAMNGVVTMTSAALNPNSDTNFRFRVKASQAGNYVMSAQVTASSSPDPDSQPDSGTNDGQDDAAQIDIRTAEASAYLAVSPNPNQLPLPQLISNQPLAESTKADLSLSLSSNTLSPKAGEVISVTLTVSNRGGSAASTIKLQSLLPAGWSLAGTTGVVLDEQTVYGYINQLPAGKTDYIELRIRVGSSANSLQAQIMDMAPGDSDSTPGNGFTNGEDDEAILQVRVQ